MSNLSDFYPKPPSAIGHYRRLKEQELQAQVAPVVHAAALAVEMFGEDELERWAEQRGLDSQMLRQVHGDEESNAAHSYAEQRRQALQKAGEGLMPLHPVCRTGSVPCDGWTDPFRVVVRPANGYRDPEADLRPIIEVEVDCSCCHGTGYYHSRYSYCGPCRLCNGSGLVTVRAYPKAEAHDAIPGTGHTRCCL